MVDDLATQPLLRAQLDPPNQHPKKLDAKKRRLRRCQSAPSVDLLLETHKTGGKLPVSKFFVGKSCISFKQVILFLAIYLAVASVCFYLVRDQIKGQRTDWILDALYFSVVTMTTVGYGDLVPNSTTSKLLACAFVFTGMAIIALFISKAADYLVEKQETLLVKALNLHSKAGEAHLLREAAIKRVQYKFIVTTVLLLVIIVTGTIFLTMVEKLNLVDAFYCVCSTITTLGYGDKSFSTQGGRVFAVFWILAGSICVAQFFFYLAELNTEHRQQLLAQWVLTRRMTFVDLEAADMDGDNVVGAAEFIIYKLKEMGKISEEDIALVMEEFEDLDVDQSGTISKSDLVMAQPSP